MIDVVPALEKHGLKNSVFNRTWLRAVYYTCFIASLPVATFKAIFNR